VSPRYIKSEWGRKEIDEFCRAADQQGGRSTFQFSNYRENTGLADSVFAFKIPRGADVISR